MTPRQIGRFEIQRTLGSGGQGAVYLARDPQLDRLVALKTLRNSGQAMPTLLQEARIASRLQHANIITLFDAGEHQSTPYLVYAYVDGLTLAQELKSKQRLPATRAAEITNGVLDGLAYAHAQGIVHLDIKPANVMIAANGAPMVMDFGLAQLMNDQGQAARDPQMRFALSGSPRYMAPELIDGHAGTVLSDVYSAGAVLYEMLTGQHAVRGESLYEVLNRAANGKITAPSAQNESVDEQLEAIVLKAVARNPAERYASALDMKTALQDYLGAQDAAVANAHTNDSAGGNSTLDFLLRRMRTKKDFPALSGSIAEINRIVATASSSNSTLASTILKDFSLTSKLLKLVNAATYGQFGGSINTVSKAVVILGFDTIRSIASSLIFIEFLQDKAQAGQVRDEVTHAIFASIVAAQLSVGQKVRDAEEVMVCSMFHNLGRLLSAYYFFEESQAIARRVEQGESETQAAQKVLGITYPELGAGIARSWNFSPRLITGMSKLETIKAGKNELDHLSATVNLANELSAAVRSAGMQNKPKSKDQLFGDLIKRYSPALKVTTKDLGKALDTALNEFTRRATMLGVKAGNTPLLDHIRAWNGKPSDAQAQKPSPNEDLPQGVVRLEQTVSKETESARPTNPEVVLGAGIQDVTNSLVGDFRLNDVLQMILETIYRGMGFHRAMLLIRDNRQNIMAARCGFGAGVDTLIPGFRFALDGVPDVFYLALNKGLDIAIENTQAPNIAGKIPAWYRSHINAPCFLLLPAVVKDRTICMFYADMPARDSLNTSQQQLSLLRTLRNQAVLAIKQKM